MKWSAERTVAVVLGLALAALVANATVSYRITRHLISNDARIAGSHAVVSELAALLPAVQDAESAEREYAATGGPDALPSYRAAAGRAEAAIARLNLLLQDDPGQTEKAGKLRDHVNALLQMLARNLANRQPEGPGHSAPGFVPETELAETARIHELVRDLDGFQAQMLRHSAVESAASGRAGLSAFVIANAIAALLVLLTWRVMSGAMAARRGAEDIARREHASLQAVLSSMGDAVIAGDEHDAVVFMNTVAEALTGVAQAEAVGRDLNGIVKIEQAGGSSSRGDAMTSVAEGDSSVGHPDFVLARRDGVRVPIEFSRRILRDAQGARGGIVLVIRDATERRRVETERAALLVSEQNARARAEEASRAKDEFLALISHEIRTPINAILGWVQLLRMGGAEGPEGGRAIEIIERNARTQARLVEELLEMSRIVTGDMRLDIATVEIGAVLHAVIESLRFTSDTKGVVVTFHRNISEAPVEGDANRLQQVFWNLVSNGIKFTPRNGHVEVRLEQSETDWLITVQDSGAGIPAEFLPHLYDRFSQADSTSRRPQGGLGLGLAISKHIVGLHHGRIEVVSPGAGGGSTFTVVLPRARAAQEPAAGAGLAPETAVLAETLRLDGIRILIVDDDEDSSDALFRLLKQRGAELEARRSAAAALEALAAWLPDVLVSDIAMPDEDGLSLIGKIRAQADPRRARLPALALTAYAGGDERTRALAAGFNMHMAKPTRVDSLVRAIRSLVAQSERSSPA